MFPKPLPKQFSEAERQEPCWLAGFRCWHGASTFIFVLGAFKTMQALEVYVIHHSGHFVAVVFVQQAPCAANAFAVITSGFFS